MGFRFGLSVRVGTRAQVTQKSAAQRLVEARRSQRRAPPGLAAEAARARVGCADGAARLHARAVAGALKVYSPAPSSHSERFSTFDLGCQFELAQERRSPKKRRLKAVFGIALNQWFIFASADGSGLQPQVKDSKQTNDWVDYP